MKKHINDQLGAGSALLVGKDNALQEMMASVLVDMGISSESKQSGHCGEMSLNRCPNIIIIDCSQPGDEHQSDVVNLNRSEMIPTILISPYTLLELNYQPKGHQVFLDKPFELNDFISSVDYLLGPIKSRGFKPSLYA